MFDATDDDDDDGRDWRPDFRPRTAKLDGRNVVPLDDQEAWFEWFTHADRAVCVTPLGGAVVSTVFLGVDHGFGGTPLWFETAVFRKDQGAWVGERYATWDEAEIGHKLAVQQERMAFHAWADGPAGLRRVRVVGWLPGVAFLEGEDARPMALVYRNRRRVPLRVSTYRRRFWVPA